MKVKFVSQEDLGLTTPGLDTSIGIEVTGAELDLFRFGVRFPSQLGLLGVAAALEDMAQAVRDAALGGDANVGRPEAGSQGDLGDWHPTPGSDEEDALRLESIGRNDLVEFWRANWDRPIKTRWARTPLALHCEGTFWRVKKIEDGVDNANESK